jgi:hypothetical protein
MLLNLTKRKGTIVTKWAEDCFLKYNFFCWSVVISFRWVCWKDGRELNWPQQEILHWLIIWNEKMWQLLQKMSQWGNPSFKYFKFFVEPLLISFSQVCWNDGQELTLSYWLQQEILHWLIIWNEKMWQLLQKNEAMKYPQC